MTLVKNKKSKKLYALSAVVNELVRINERLSALEKVEANKFELKKYEYNNKMAEEFCPKCGKKLIGGPLF